MDTENSNVPFYKSSRLKSLLKSREYSDCLFIIDGEKIEAHKLLLACSSPVFEKMLYGPLSSNEIEVLDVDVNEFKQMLEYVYTNNVILSSVQNAWNLYYIANKYLLDDLVGFCLSFIERNLTMNTLALSYELANIYNENSLENWCWRDMVLYSKGVLLCDSDHHMKLTTLRSLLEESTALNQYDVVMSVIRWAWHECAEKQLELSSTNIIDLIIDTNLLKYVSISDATEKRVLENLKSFSDITMQECMENLLQLVNEKGEQNYARFENTENLCKPRLNYVFRERQLYKIAKQISLEEGDGFYCKVESSRKVILFGLVINTEHQPFNAKVPVYEGANTIIVERDDVEPDVHARFVSKMNYDSTQYIPFDELLVLESDQSYTIRISYSNVNIGKSSVILHYLSHKLCCQKNDTVFTFFETCGSVVRALCYYPA